MAGGVVITGASTGIGRACALHLDSLGFQVFAGVRREADADRLRADGSERLTPVILDVTDRESIQDAAGRVGESVDGRGLAGLVNNAGIAVPAPLEFIGIDDLRHQLEVNLIGQVAVTQAFMPLLRVGNGRVVNVGSVGGRVALPFLGPYAASKFAMEAVSDSMRRELRPWGISVSLLEPGSVATSIWERGSAAGETILDKLPARARELYGERIGALRAAAEKAGEDSIPAERVARVIEHALTSAKPKTRYPVGRGVRARIVLSKLLPDRVFDRLIARATGT